MKVPDQRPPVRRPPGWMAVVTGLILGITAASSLPERLEAAGGMTLLELGQELCRNRAEVCASTWSLGKAQGLSFNKLIHLTCKVVENKRGDHEGIDCVERAIAASERLSTEALLAGQFKPGEREDNPVWQGLPDEVWAERIKVMIRRVPAYCDENTPVIYNYFACIANEVLSLTIRLKKLT